MTGRKSKNNGDLYERIIINFLARRKGIVEKDIVVKQDNIGLSNHKWDLEIPKLNLKIEVKGSLRIYSNKVIGKFAFKRQKHLDKIDLFVFVFGRMNPEIIFLTYRQIEGLIRKDWIEQENAYNIRRLKMEEIREISLLTSEELEFRIKEINTMDNMSIIYKGEIFKR